MDCCNEIYMHDVVRVDIVPSERCRISMPFNVPGIVEIFDPDIGMPALSMGLEGDDFTVVIDNPVAVKDTVQRQPAGYIHNISMNVVCQQGFSDIREAQKELQGVDFNVVLTTADECKYLCYALPNTSSMVNDDQMGSDSSINVKISMSSLSGYIRIPY